MRIPVVMTTGEQRSGSFLPAARAARLGLLLVLVLAGMLAVGGCASAPAAETGARQPRVGCQVDLLVQFSPSVARPSSTAFLQGLVQGSGYDLRFVRTLGTTLLLRLTGPDTTCDDGIALLRRSAGVRSVEIDERQFRHQIRKPEA